MGKLLIWTVSTACGAVVAGVVVFLSLQTLDNADKWSSIGGFVTSMLTAAAGAMMWATVRRREEHAPPETERRALATSRRWFILNYGNRVVINGSGTKNYIGTSEQENS